MLNALEKVMYPNGKAKALGDIVSGSVSSIIDEVHANTSAISSITAQLSALVDDVGTNTSAITTINNKLLEVNAGLDYLDLTREVVPFYEGVDLTTVFPDEIAEFSDEWAWINNRVNTGNFYGLHVGDYIQVVTSETTPKTYKAVIMGMNTYTGFGDTDHEVGNHIDWCFAEVWSEKKAYNAVGYNNGLSTQSNPFLASDLNLWLNSKSGTRVSALSPITTESVDYTSGGVLHYLPAKLKAVITKKRMHLPGRYSADNILNDDNSWSWQDMDDLWIPFECEVNSAPIWSPHKYGNSSVVQYKLFADDMKRCKKDLSGAKVGYWLASERDNNNNGFCTVDPDGTADCHAATDVIYSVTPCFRTGGVTLTTRKKASKKKGE